MVQKGKIDKIGVIKEYNNCIVFKEKQSGREVFIFTQAPRFLVKLFPEHFKSESFYGRYFC